MMKVKICGITNLKDALLAVNFGADMLGFIFYRKSKRFITFDEAKKIIDLLPKHIEVVGVFVNEELETVNAASHRIGLTKLQLHGNEDMDYIQEVTLPVIKAFCIKDNFDFTSLSSYPNCTFLLDAYSNSAMGGTGKTFDWEIIPEEIRTQIILAGGISSNNIEYVYKNIKPMAVDISSSVELYPGKKDTEKLLEFFNKINQLRKQNE